MNQFTQLLPRYGKAVLRLLHTMAFQCQLKVWLCHCPHVLASHGRYMNVLIIKNDIVQKILWQCAFEIGDRHYMYSINKASKAAIAVQDTNRHLLGSGKGEALWRFQKMEVVGRRLSSAGARLWPSSFSSSFRLLPKAFYPTVIRLHKWKVENWRKPRTVWRMICSDGGAQL